jgi:RecB family endonuclease NucS
MNWCWSSCHLRSLHGQVDVLDDRKVQKEELYIHIPFHYMVQKLLKEDEHVNMLIHDG